MTRIALVRVCLVQHVNLYIQPQLYQYVLHYTIMYLLRLLWHNLLQLPESGVHSDLHCVKPDVFVNAEQALRSSVCIPALYNRMYFIRLRCGICGMSIA